MLRTFDVWRGRGRSFCLCEGEAEYFIEVTRVGWFEQDPSNYHTEKETVDTKLKKSVKEVLLKVY